MEQLALLAQMLELVERPAFAAKDGRIALVNQAAASRMLAVHDPIAPMLDSAQADAYGEFSGGALYLTLHLPEANVGASVQKIGDYDLFLLGSGAADKGLHTLALAARELRQPLYRILAIADQWTSNHTEADSARLAALNQGLHQLLRLVGNMTSASDPAVPWMVLRDVTAVMAELVERAESLCQAAGIRLEFVNHPSAVYSMLDSDMVEQAFYHLLSNAMKRTQSGGTIHMTFTQKDRLMELCVSDPGNGPSHPITGDIFHQYRREPGSESSFYGIGLGMRVIQLAATAHGGAVRLEHLPTGGVCVTMTLAISQKTGIRTPTLRVESSASRNAGLVQLSELLPTELYDPSHF